MEITKAQALAIASKDLKNRDGYRDATVNRVVAYEKAGPLHLYLAFPDLPENHWVAFVRKPDGEQWLICSSTIMLIHKKTGKVTYFGSAHDEG